MNAQTEKETVWTQFECGAGSRWNSASGPFFYDYTGLECSFSGCNCGTKVRKVSATTDREVASRWFGLRVASTGI